MSPVWKSVPLVYNAFWFGCLSFLREFRLEQKQLAKEFNWQLFQYLNESFWVHFHAMTLSSARIDCFSLSCLILFYCVKHFLLLGRMKSTNKAWFFWWLVNWFYLVLGLRQNKTSFFSLATSWSVIDQTTNWRIEKFVKENNHYLQPWSE